MSGLQRYCTYHDGWVDQTQATIIGFTETSPGLTAWACLPCLASRNDPTTGHTTVAPTTPGDAA